MKHVFLFAAVVTVQAWASIALAQPAPAPAAPAAPATPTAPAPATPPVAADAEALKAVVTAIKGNVQVRATEQDKWAAAKIGAVLGVGADIRTGLNSAVKLTIEGGHEISVDRLGTVKLLTLVKDKNLIKTDIGMKYGRTNYKVEVGGGVHDSKVHSPAATLVIRGSDVTVTDDALGSYATGEGKLTFINNMRRQAIAFGGEGKATVTQDRPHAASVAVKASTLDPLGAFIARTLAEGEMLESENGVGGADYIAVVELQRLAKQLQGGGVGVANLPGPLDFSLVWSGIADLDLAVTDPGGFTISKANPSAGVFPTQGNFGTDDTGSTGSGFEEVRYLEFFKKDTYHISVRHNGGADASFFIVANQGITADPLTVTPQPPSTISAGQTVNATVSTK